ncbi:MAG: 50S ribosomal protein L21 [Acidobacteriota bacterium]|nr:MAG: 50S ribosomal protein L21 [Acidobacteriota bacterium]
MATNGTPYAVIEAGGRQVRVSPGDVLAVDRLAAEPGAEVTFDRVLLVAGDDLKIGAPTVEGASVRAKVLREERGPKVIVFRKRRRTTFRRTRGHRQEHTIVRIESIEA